MSDARTEAIEAVRPLCKRLGANIAKNSGGVFDANDAASDMMIGAIECYDNIDPAAFEDEAKIHSAVANAVHRDYQDMLRKATNVEPDESMTAAGNVNRRARGTLRVAKDAANVVADPVDVPLMLDLDAKLNEMDGIDDEICHRLMDGMTRAAICRELKLTPASYDSRIVSIQHSLRSLKENQ